MITLWSDVIATADRAFSKPSTLSTRVIVRAGEVLTIPPHLPHSALALEDTLDVDIFNPPREDWLDGSDAYLRR